MINESETLSVNNIKEITGSIDTFLKSCQNLAPPLSSRKCNPYLYIPFSLLKSPTITII
jgi:hypothetical protein